jgi:beta-glucanase (GH16 family)
MILLAALLARPAPVRGDTPLWADEFDGPAGTAPDPTRWTPEIGAGGWGNGELQYYTDRPENVALDGDGHLAITARRESYGGAAYTSARLKTQGTYRRAYGRFEARIKLPRGAGLWPAFWMLGDDLPTVGWPGAGEIDVMEQVGHEPGVVHSSLHGPGFSGGASLTSAFALAGGSFADDFHTFTADWSPGRIRFLVDGVEFRRFSPANLPAGGRWVFDHPFFLLLNLAVGGAWPGAPPASTAFPQTMLIDHVRVFSGDGAAVDVARGRPARASSSEAADLGPERAVDGDPRTRWSSRFADGQWLQVDLGGRFALDLVHVAWESAHAADYLVELSDDAERWRTVSHVSGSDGGTDDLPVTGVGRYLRIVGQTRATPYGVSIYDLEATGSPVPAAAPAPTDPASPEAGSDPRPASDPPAPRGGTVPRRGNAHPLPTWRLRGPVLRIQPGGRSSLLASCSASASVACTARIRLTTRTGPRRVLATAAIRREPGEAARAVRLALRPQRQRPALDAVDARLVVVNAAQTQTKRLTLVLPARKPAASRFGSRVLDERYGRALP